MLFKLKPKLIISFFLLLFTLSCAANRPSSEPQISYRLPFPYARKVRPPAYTKPYKINGRHYHPLKSARGFSQRGLASWYGRDFHGRRTANGEIYNMYAMTAAHKTLPLGTWVRVYNLRNKRQVVVRINDRGPFVRNRIIDLSYKAAKKLGIVGPGTAPVKIVALGVASGARGSAAASVPVRYTPINYWKGNFTVQVGAFMELKNAERFKKKLSKRYSNAHITSFTDFRGRFFRVRVGKFSNLKNARNFTLKLMVAGARMAFAVAE